MRDDSFMRQSRDGPETTRDEYTTLLWTLAGAHPVAVIKVSWL
jgi:hypothetical protein